MSSLIFLHYHSIFLWATLPWCKDVDRSVSIVRLRNKTGSDRTMESLSMVNNAKSLLWCGPWRQTMDRVQHAPCLGIQLAVVNALHIGMRPYLYIWNQYNALRHSTCLQIIKTNKFQSCFVKGSWFCRPVSVLPSHYYIRDNRHWNWRRF